MIFQETANLTSVYVIGPADGAVKVGLAKDVRSRVATLQTGHPHQLLIHHQIECAEASRIEGFAHRMLRHCRLNGEWFSCSVAVARHAVEYGIERALRGHPLDIRCFRFKRPRPRKHQFTVIRKDPYNRFMSDCPLLQYLARHEEVPYRFAARASMSQATIYALLKGTYTGVRWETLRLIEEHTCGEVTVQIMSDWLTERLIEKGETDERRADPRP